MITFDFVSGPISMIAISPKVHPSNVADLKPTIVPMYEIYKKNNESILNQLEDWVVDYVDDDIEMSVSSKGYAKPLNTTENGFIKLENPDEISGNIEFKPTVNINSDYPI